MMQRRAWLLGAVLGAAIAGVGAASALVPQSTEPVDDPAKYEPDGTPAAVHRLAADPSGGPDWGVRVYVSKAGLTCPEAGRVQEGVFGRAVADGRFSPLAAAAAGACGDLASAPLAFAVNRYVDPPRDVVFGYATPHVTGVELVDGSLRQTLVLDNGAFLAVRARGGLDGAVLEVTLDDGSTRRYTLVR